MAERFKKSPIELLFPDGDYTVMEAQMFNLFILRIGIIEESRGQK